MKRVLCIVILAAVLIFSTCMPVFSVSGTRFSDIKDTDWFSENVYNLVGKGILDGYTDGTFKPDSNISIDAFIKITVIAMGYDIEKGQGYWAEPFIQKALELGLIEAGEFSDYPAPITRVQMAKIIACALKEAYSENIHDFGLLIKDFNDVPEKYREYVLKAFVKGIITGKPDGSFAPNDKATRAEAATMIVRLLDAGKRKPPVLSGTGVTVYNVQDAEGFIKAIGPDREIILKSGTYVISESSLISLKSDYIKWQETYDGYELLVINVKNLTISAEAGKNASILVKPSYSNVLSFSNSQNITLNNITFGHGPEKGYCTGGVLVFSDCSNVVINGCDLFGCGTEGLTITNVDIMKFNNSVIRDCSYGIMTVDSSRNLEFSNSSFRNCEEFDLINIIGGSNVTFTGCKITGNKTSTSYGEYIGCSLFNIGSGSEVTVRNSTISGNMCDLFEKNKNSVALENVTVENNTFVKQYEGEPGVLTSSDGRIQISLAEGWEEASGFNNEAILQAYNAEAYRYLVIIRGNKAYFSDDAKINDYYKLVKQNMASRVENARFVGPTTHKINDCPAMRFVLYGTVNKLKIAYHFTLVETDGYFYQIVFWTFEEEFNGSKDEFVKLSDSFMEIEPDGD